MALPPRAQKDQQIRWEENWSSYPGKDTRCKGCDWPQRYEYCAHCLPYVDCCGKRAGDCVCDRIVICKYGHPGKSQKHCQMCKDLHEDHDDASGVMSTLISHAHRLRAALKKTETALAKARTSEDKARFETTHYLSTEETLAAVEKFEKTEKEIADEAAARGVTVYRILDEKRELLKKEKRNKNLLE